MSTQRITEAAKKFWINSESALSYKDFIFACKSRGLFWSAADE